MKRQPTPAPPRSPQPRAPAVEVSARRSRRADVARELDELEALLTEALGALATIRERLAD